MQINRKYLARMDFLLLFFTVIVLILGMNMVYSSSSFRAEKLFENNAHYLQKHIIRLAIGVVVMVIFALVDYRRWLILSPLFFWFGFALLIMLFLPLPFVVTSKGASRWMNVGFMTIQPSDFARYALILVLARVLTSERDKLEDFWGGFLKIFFLVVLIVVPIAFEKDLGTAALVILIAFAMFYIAEVRVSYILAVATSCVSAGLFFMGMNNYQFVRFEKFINMLLGDGNPGWHLRQSLISFAEGGVLGKGLGYGQQKYEFLPEAHKDFIFSVVGEELGFIGATVTLLFFFLIFYRGIRIAQYAPNGYARLLAGGISICIGAYAFINAAVALALLPTTGIPMPFMSYGGSALVSHLAAVGILLNISMQGSKSYSRQEHWQVYNKRLKRPVFSGIG
jgi:cell division protein FtsW